MSLISYIGKALNDFRGAWTIRDQTGQNAARGSVAQNVRMTPGQVFTRPGTALALGLSGAIQSMYNWIALDTVFGRISRLVYLSGTVNVGLYDLGAGTNINPLYALTVGSTGLSVVEGDKRLYVAPYDNLGRSTAFAKVINALIGGAPADLAFPDPPGDVFTVNDTGVGACTPGLHYFAYRIETRSGFPGRIAVSGIGVNVTTGTVTFNCPFAPTPTDAAFIHISMTTVDNKFLYKDVASVAIPAGAGFTVNVAISIPDTDIVALPDSTDVTNNFFYLTLSNGAPAPSKIVRYGNRNVYINGQYVFISDPYNAQVLLNPDNVVQVEGQRVAVTAEVLGDNLVIFCPTSTHVLGGDNVNTPRQWAPPSRVSDTIGTVAINGVCPSAGFNFLWVAHDSGLYTFSGAYSPIPISYMFANDWKRINWAAAATIAMVDNASENCLYINVPLDGATVPNYRMVLDYSRARNLYGQVDPLSIDYSLDDYNSASSVPSMALITNYALQIRELWLGLTTGQVLRHVPGLRTDNTTHPIRTVYETGLNLAASDSRTLLNRFGGVQADVTGSGQLTVKPYGLGRQTIPDDPVDPIQLSANPDGESEARWHMNSENQTIRFETGVNAGDWMQLQGLTIFHKPSGTTKAS